MKIRFSGILGFALALTAFCAINANAQEGVPNNEIPDFSGRPEFNLNEDKTLIFEPERTASSSEKSNSKEQAATTTSRTTKPKSGEATGKNTSGKNPEDDALSFNFLYYIIQKFKISDIVEQ